MISPPTSPVPGSPAEFRPWPLARGGHAQTLVGHLVRSRAECRYDREVLATPDGDRVSLDWAGPARPRPESADGQAAGPPVLLVLHGLEGSSASGYAREAVRAALGAGLRAAVLNFRSCDGAPNLLLRSYHSGATDDPAQVVRHIRGRYPGAPVVALGFSLGGNVLLKYLAEAGSGSGLAAAATVSVPFDLAASAAWLERTDALPYRRYFLRSLKRKAAWKALRFPGAFDARAAARARTLREFDEAVTAPVHGFASATDYYARCSSLPLLAGVATPTLLLQARDDPFVPPATLSRVAEVPNPALRRLFPDRGGHVGFLETAPRGAPRPWAEPVLVDWLDRARSASSGAPAARMFEGRPAQSEPRTRSRRPR